MVSVMLYVYVLCCSVNGILCFVGCVSDSVCQLLVCDMCVLSGTRCPYIVY